MSAHLDDRLADFLVGTLPAAEHEEAERHVDECAQCAAEVAELADVAGALALIAPPEAASPTARARLLAGAGGDRLGAMLDRLAAFFDLTVEKAREVVARAAAPSEWQPGPLPQVSLFHLTAGPRYANADAGLVRFQRGTRFPSHRHLGEERVLVIEGTLIENDGTRVRPGDLRVMPAGSTHSFEVAPDEDSVYALVLHRGIEILPG